MSKTEKNKDKIDKAGPHNGRNVILTLLIVSLLGPLAFMDYERWDKIIREVNHWEWIKSTRDKKKIIAYIENKYRSNRFKNEATLLYKEIVQKERKERIAQIKKRIEKKIKYLKLLNLSKKNDAIMVQKLLKLHGYYHGVLDGRTGKSTLQAIRDYKKDHNLPDTSIWDIETQIKMQLVDKYKGSDILSTHLSKHTQDIIDGTNKIISMQKNPRKEIPELLRTYEKKYKRKFMGVIDILRVNNIKTPSFVAFRKWGKLVAYKKNGERFKLNNKLIKQIHKIEKARSQKGKMIKTELIIAMDPKKLVTRSHPKGSDVEYHNVFLRKSGQIKHWKKITFITFGKNFTSQSFVINGKFNRAEFIKSIFAPEMVKAKLYYPVYSNYDGWVKLDTIRVKMARDPDDTSIEDLSVDIVNKKQVALATYSNIIFIRPGRVKKGEFFALSLHKDLKNLQHSPNKYSPYFNLDIKKIRSAKYNSSKHKTTARIDSLNKNKLANYMKIGRHMYSLHCSACHQKNGKGVGPFPDLTKSDVVREGPGSIIRVLNNTDSKNKIMPPFTHLGSSKLLAISKYVYNTFNH